MGFDKRKEDGRADVYGPRPLIDDFNWLLPIFAVVLFRQDFNDRLFIDEYHDEYSLLCWLETKMALRLSSDRLSFLSFLEFDSTVRLFHRTFFPLSSDASVASQCSFHFSWVNFDSVLASFLLSYLSYCLTWFDWFFGFEIE